MSVKNIKSIIHAKDTDIAVISAIGQDDYISLTDIARYRSDEPKDVIKNWLRSKATIEFLGLWEELNNPNFKGVEFDSFRNEAGANAFTLSPQKWIDATNAIGIISRSGRYGGTYAHKDIALSSPHGYLPNSSCISSRTISGLNPMKLTGSLWTGM